jgi:hypothetical protein
MSENRKIICRIIILTILYISFIEYFVGVVIAKNETHKHFRSNSSSKSGISKRGETGFEQESKFIFKPSVLYKIIID